MMSVGFAFVHCARVLGALRLMAVGVLVESVAQRLEHRCPIRICWVQCHLELGFG